MQSMKPARTSPGSDGGGTEPTAHPPTPNVHRLVQLWFAGNHSDIGGSYPEPESRLSDIALAWMCEQAMTVPDGLKTGPIYVDHVKMPNTGDAGPALNIFPRADGIQHCEIAGMRDTLETYAAKLPKWRWLQSLVGTKNWEVEVREINQKAPVHETVRTRFGLPQVTQCARVGAYRPDALANHDDFKQYYSRPEASTKLTPST